MSDSAAEYLYSSQVSAKLPVPAVLLDALVIIADCKCTAAFARRTAGIARRPVKLRGAVRIAEVPADIIPWPAGVVSDGKERPFTDAKFARRAIVADSVGPLVYGQTKPAVL